jgi:hypothetical protein
VWARGPFADKLPEQPCATVRDLLRSCARAKADADGGPLPSEFEQRQRQDLTGGKETAEDASRRKQSEKADKAEKSKG